MKHYKWPSIEQYRNVVRNVKHKAQFVGLDENGEAIVNRFATMPTLRFEGTCKLHGTNSAVCVASDGEIWFQSRDNITPEKDNAGFAMFAAGYNQLWKGIAGYTRELLYTRASIHK